MKIFAFATLEEAQASITRTNASPYQGHFRFTDNLILITGIGPFAAYTQASPFIKQASALYNFGIAGALHPEIAPCTCVEVATVSKLKWHPKNPTLTESIALSGTLKLCTLDFPLHETNFLKEDFDLVDMEGYALAYLAKEHQVPIKLIKIVSDHCTENTSSDIQKNLKILSEHLAEKLTRLF